VDFSVDQLSLAAKDLGSVSFQVRPEISGASFNNISGNIFGLNPGAFVSEAPTDFFWGYNGEEHLSKLVGPIGLDNIGHFFDAMGMPPVVDSKSGRLDADMMWQDVPWAVNKSNLEGELKLSLSEGSFYKDSGGAGTALKLVSLFNFANWRVILICWMRRLMRNWLLPCPSLQTYPGWPASREVCQPL
jgi:uncharacterized protein YhdP